MASRQFVSVYECADASVTKREVPMPPVCLSPIRPDLVEYVHTQLRKNKRQPHGVKPGAGYETSAESWGTGRAVARIPRVAGGGTHRAGQGAFGNMCRGGGMYAPKNVYRRWYRSVPKNVRRYSVASCLAASCVPALVQARGHRIDAVAEIPCVVSDEIQELPKTKAAFKLLNILGLGEDLTRVQKGIRLRSGKARMRNRKWFIKRGPLFVYDSVKACERPFRNIPGVDCCHVNNLSVLVLAPGGHIGRMVIFSESAFKKLVSLWGGVDTPCTRSGYVAPRSLLTIADFDRIINSEEIQAVIKPEIGKIRFDVGKHVDAYTNLKVRRKLNPSYDEVQCKRRQALQA